MNNKKTNRIVAVLNGIAAISIYIIALSTTVFSKGFITIKENGIPIYNNIIVDLFVQKIDIILVGTNLGIGLLNIICAIQNRKNKKICFWQLIFGLSFLLSGLYLILENYIHIDWKIWRIIEWIKKALVSIVPMVLVLFNFIKIRKNKPKVIQIISYLGVIILSILSLLEVFDAHWEIVSVVMQLVYVHLQDKNIQESKSRRIVNIVLYYMIELTLSLGLLVIIIYSILIANNNRVKWDKGMNEIYNKLQTLSGAGVEELYYPVENNQKYGFISKNGQEKISCIYDRVSFFNEVENNGYKYYIALAKKANKYYIITKTNDLIEIKDFLVPYLVDLERLYDRNFAQINIGNYKYGYTYIFETIFKGWYRENKIEEQIEPKIANKEIKVESEGYGFMYQNKNYSMKIEELYLIDEENKEKTYGEEKYKVTITKPNGEIKSSIVYLKDINYYDNTIKGFSDGYIYFRTEDLKNVGWYDKDGNQVLIDSTYSIIDIKNNKIILNKIDESNEEQKTTYYVFDMSRKKLLETSALMVCNNSLLIKNINNKMVLIDMDLKQISKEYDRISPNGNADVSIEFSSYK